MNKIESLTALSRNINKLGISMREAFFIMAVYQEQQGKGYALADDVMQILGERSATTTLRRMNYWFKSVRIPNGKPKESVGYYLNEHGEKTLAFMLNFQPLKK